MSSTNRSAAKIAPFTFACPHLGMLDDTTTTTTFPSEANHCLHCKPACVPSRQQQLDYCLSQHYNDCSILHLPAPAHLPASRRWERDPAAFRAIFVKSALAVFGAGLLAMFFILGAPARISEMIQAFVPEATRAVYQPHDFSTSTPTARIDLVFSTATSFISNIQIPTSLPISQIVKLTVIELEMGVNCRAGPDTTFENFLILHTDDVLQALARDPGGTFYYVRVAKKQVPDCWVPAAYVRSLGDINTLPVLTPMPTPWPTRTPTPLPPTPIDTAGPRQPTVKPAGGVRVNTQAPQPSEPPPEPTVSTEPPLETTEPPLETTEPPSETTEPPSETTEPPE